MTHDYFNPEGEDIEELLNTLVSAAAESAHEMSTQQHIEDEQQARNAVIEAWVRQSRALAFAQSEVLRLVGLGVEQAVQIDDLKNEIDGLYNEIETLHNELTERIHTKGEQDDH